jgi:hypothetical protein
LSSVSVLDRTTPVNSPVAIPTKIIRFIETGSDRFVHSNLVIPLGFRDFFLSLDDIPTTKKILHFSPEASRQYLGLPGRPVFRAEKKGHPVPEIAGMSPAESLRPLPALAASESALPKNIRGCQGLDIRPSNPSFKQIRYGIFVP